jgi:hypothetical protein
MPAHKREPPPEPPAFAALRPHEAFLRELREQGVPQRSLPEHLREASGVGYSVGTINKFLNRDKSQEETPSGLFDRQKANEPGGG